MVNNIEKLQQVIRRLHSCDAAHVLTIPVTEKIEGRTIWDGDVELFNVRGHPKAIACYAWSFVDDSNVEHFTAILKLPPIDSANTAVRVDIVARSNNPSQKAEGWKH